MNELLLAKLLWRWHKEEGEWKNIWDFKYNWDGFDFKHFLLSKIDQEGSQIWKNAQKSKYILSKGVKWKASNGTKILFWEDSWILDHPLCEDPRWNGLMEQCKIQFGNLVSDYQRNDSWVNLLSVDLNLAELAKCLNAYCLKHDDDVPIWKKDPFGGYSISSAFSFSFEDFEAPCWALAWVKGMMPKINIFFWILLQNKILTLDNLKKRGIHHY